VEAEQGQARRAVRGYTPGRRSQTHPLRRGHRTRAGKESCEGLNTREKVTNSLAAKRTPNEGRQGDL